MATRSTKATRTNTVPLLVALVGVALLVLLVVAWVLPPLQERGALSDDAEAFERAAEETTAELQKLTSGDSASADLAARAAAGDSYFRYFPPSIEDKVNEANLVFPELFAAAARDVGLTPRVAPDEQSCDILLGFPASGSDVKPPAGLGAVELTVSLLGAESKPQEFLNSLRRQQVLATVTSVVVSEAGADDLCASGSSSGTSSTSRGRDDGVAPSELSRSGNIAHAAVLRHDLRIVVWYTTEPPVELDRNSAGG